MAQALLSRGWDFEVERGPDWLFVTPRRTGSAAADVPFAEQVWALLEQQFTHRLVLELSQLQRLDSEMIGQLLWLYKRVHSHGGLIRVCGLSADNAEVLRDCRLQNHFPMFANREDAVMGHVRIRLPR